MGAKAALIALRQAEAHHVPIEAITADEGLQPRVTEVVRHGQRGTTRKLSEQHTVTLLRRLEGDARTELAPILVAHTEVGLLVVDGFHRLRAYELAERKTIPARIYPMKRATAAMAAKLANLDQRALDLHPDQRREALWQWLVAVTSDTGEGLPSSQRKIAAWTGVARATLASMLKHMPAAARREWPKDDCDPVTGFVRWNAVRFALQDRFSEKHSDDDEGDEVDYQTNRKADALAERIVTALSEASPVVRKRGLARVMQAIHEGELPDDDGETRALVRAAQRARFGADDEDADF